MGSQALPVEERESGTACLVGERYSLPGRGSHSRTSMVHPAYLHTWDTPASLHHTVLLQHGTACSRGVRWLRREPWAQRPSDLLPVLHFLTLSALFRDDWYAFFVLNTPCRTVRRVEDRMHGGATKPTDGLGAYGQPALTGHGSHHRRCYNVQHWGQCKKKDSIDCVHNAQHRWTCGY